MKEPVNFSTGGIGASAYVETVMLYNALKLPIKIQTGYYGSDDPIALRRGDIQGTLASRSSWELFVANGHGRFIAQIGGSNKDVPQLRDMVTDEKAKALIALIQSQGDIQRFTAGPPDIPKDRLDALRAAYRKAMEDPELQAKAAKLERPIEPAYGDDVLADDQGCAEADAGDRRAAETGAGSRRPGSGANGKGGSRGMGWTRQNRAQAG